MKLSEIYDVREIFKPHVYYEGEWFLTRDVMMSGDHFMLNALVDKKGNKYQAFLDKYYYGPLGNLFGKTEIARALYPRIALTDAYSDTGRGPHFSHSHLLFDSVKGAGTIRFMKFLDDVTPVTTTEELSDLVRDVFREERKKLNDAPSRTYREDPVVSKLRKEAGFLTTAEYIQEKAADYTKIIRVLRDLDGFFRKEINTDELIECFDYDKLSLLTAVSILTACNETEIITGKLPYCFTYLHLYIKAVEYLREQNGNYNCKIVDADNKGKKTTITFDDVNKQFKEMLARYPEMGITEYDRDKLFNFARALAGDKDIDFSSRENQKLFNEALNLLDEGRELSASWEFLPPGESNDILTRTRGEGTKNSVQLSQDEKIRRMVFAKYHLDNSLYLYSLKGVNSFAGFVGYIYPNGMVIFEQFYKDEACTKVAADSATYVMNLFKFIELSKMSKTEIITKIKYEGTEDVKRIYHSANMDKWKNKIDRAIRGIDYGENVMSYINMLLGEEVVKKLRKK